MKIGEALSYQQRNGNRDQATGLRRTDGYAQKVGGPVCAALVIVCIAPLVTKGFMSLINTITGKSAQYDNHQVGGHHNNKCRF